jgi:transcriptional regulator with XRE-family HTH domain
MVAASRRFLRHLLPTYGVPSITALCQRLGLHKQYAWLLWHGKIGLSTAMLRRLHDALGVPLEELLRVERATPAKAAGRKPRRQRPKPKGRPSTPPPGEGTP